MTERRSILALDLSGVLFEFDPERRLAALSELCGLAPAEVRARVWESGASPRWDAGSRATAAEVRRELRDALTFTGPDQALDDAWGLAFRPLPRAIGLLPRMPDPTLVAFSNNGPFEEELLTRRHPAALSGFGALWLTHRLGATKPAAAAYRALERALGVDPDQITLLDDSPANVEAARAAGWHAQLCRSTKDLCCVLRDHGAGGRLPLQDVPEPAAQRLRELGGRRINLYRTLANQPSLLDAWIDYAWALRGDCETPRALRELIILRVAQLTGATYEWTAHVEMAHAAGLDDARIGALDRWRDGDGYDERERVALAFVEAMHGGYVDDPTFAALRARFTTPEIVEITLTASTYLGLGTLLEALRVPPDAQSMPPR